MARQEASGQFTLIGAMPGNYMEVVSTGPGATGSGILLGSFTVFALFDYMTGITELETQCEVLKGQEAVHRTPPEKDRRANPKARFHTQVFTFSPLPLPGFGDYQFKIILKADGRTLSFAKKLTIARGGG